VFFVSFMLAVSSKAHEELRATAERKGLSVPKLVHRYAKEWFEECICEETDEESGQSFAASVTNVAIS
jgi:hypothetical protein